MNIVKTIEQYDDNYLFFCEPIKNNIMNEGIFVRILYSSDLIVFNGIYLSISLNEITCDKYYNKYKCYFNINSNKDIITKIQFIEENILKKYNSNKKPLFRIYEQLSSGHIKLFNYIENKNNNLFILKISGIWETNDNYGITYKFIKIN